MKYRLLATDLDGTLLNEIGDIPDENKTAINHLVRNEVRFVIVTGRPMISVDKYIYELGMGSDSNYAILLNGAEIRELNTNKIIFEKKLDKDIAQIIREEYSKYDLEIIMFNSNMFYIESMEKNAYKYVSKYGIQYDVLSKDAPLLNDVSKVLVVGENKILKEFEKNITEILKDSVNMFYSNPNFLEFTNREIDKGTAVSILAEMLDIQIEEVICVGDNFNDASMLKIAGLSVAPSNAETEIKRFVKYVAKCTNNDGVIKEIVQTFM